MSNRVIYRVRYGRNLSHQDFTSWRAACDFMRCLLADYEQVSVVIAKSEAP